MGLRVEKYCFIHKQAWDNFVKQSKNGHFFFYRAYMEYHADRFADHSLLIFDDNKLIALLPANIKDQTLYSHQGLSFGGFITDTYMKAGLMLEIFAAVKTYLLEQTITKLIYKCIPVIYHQVPAEEDLYALFINGAKLYRRDCTSSILLTNRVAYQERRGRAINKAKKQGLLVAQSDDWAAYWNILEEVLVAKYGRKPVHSLEEMQSLVAKFPNNIKLFAALDANNKMLAGTVVYENPTVIHTQYLSSSDAGKELGALDLVLDYLITDHYKDAKFFDFGISTEDDGKYLNEGLMAHKEGFGARSIVHDFYEWQIS